MIYFSTIEAPEEAFPWLPIIGGCVGFVVVVALILTIVLICRRYVSFVLLALLFHFLDAVAKCTAEAYCGGTDCQFESCTIHKENTSVE